MHKLSGKTASWQRATGMVFVGSIGLVLIGWAIVSLLQQSMHHPTSTYAQVDEELGLEIEKTLEGSEVVQVGQVLEFTIRIRNTGTHSITHLVVEDVFDTSIVEPARYGQFAEPGDPPPMEPSGTLQGNTIVWDDIVENLPNGELAPQEEMILKVYLRAIHPSEALLTVNRAAIKEAVGRGGRKVSDVGEDAYNNDVGGNNAPVTKVLMTEPPIYAGMLVTYTIQVKNEGLVPIFSIPLRDAYNPGVLEFVRAVPPPSASNQAIGELQWSDVLALVGRSRLEPGETLDITTVYRAIQAVDESTNEVEVSGASDKYGNVLTPRHAQAPIRIVQAPSDTPIAIATMVITATATATLQPTAAITATQPITTATATATATHTPVLVQPTATPTITPWVPTPAPNSPDDDSDGDGDDDQDDDQDDD